MKYENAFDEIAEQYYNAIYRYCLVRLGDEHLAADCTQDVFLTLYKKLDRLKLTENIRAWLYRTADYVMRNQKRKMTDTVPLDELTEVAADDSAFQDSMLDDILTKDELDLLNAYYITGESAKEISKRLGISEAALAKRLYRIKRRIEKSLYNYNKNQ